MQKLEKILEEIEQAKREPWYRLSNYDVKHKLDGAINRIVDIIRKHINEGWISVDKELPPNAKHEGALCPRYQVMTKYGVTEGWYNPDYNSWYILCWFMGTDHIENEIDFERGTCPKVVRCENAVNDKHSIVLAWRSLPEPYQLERSE